MTRTSEEYRRTLNALVDGELRDRRALKMYDDPRRPRDISPCHVTIIWDGASAVEAGRVVKLGGVVGDPATDDSVPFSGLVFHADVLSASDTTRAIAITREPIEGGGEGVGEAVIPQAYWCRINVTNAAHTFAKVITGGTLFDSDASATYPILWKQSGTGEKWAVVLLTPTSTTATDPPLRRFELSATKTGLQNTATVRWLDDSGAFYGAAEVIHDPEFLFQGRAAGYLPGELGFRGTALERKDLAGVELNRWEIVEMDSFAEWAVVELYTVLPTPVWILRSFGGGVRRNRAPGLIDAAANAVMPADMLSQLVVGRRFYARLAAADTSPPTYVIVAVRAGSGTGSGELVTVYIDHDIPKAVQIGSSFSPGRTNVERYEYNAGNGRYERGAAIAIENHDSAEGLQVPEGKAYRGIASKNEAGLYVLHVAFCRPIPQVNG